VGLTAPRSTRERLDVAFVIPLSGPAGMFGPSCAACGELAVDEINAAGGVLGRELGLHVVDGAQAPAAIASEVEGLLAEGAVQAVSGWHISAVRQRLDPVVQGRVPYVYSPLYEGGEHTDGVFLTGETPERQVLPAMRWMAGELGVRTWFVIGNDYVWPRVSAQAVRSYVRAARGLRVVEEIFVPLGTEDFSGPVERVLRSDADGVLMFLVGSDAVRFNRAFARAGLDQRSVRLSPLMDENMLLGTGADNAAELYSAAGFFETLATAAGLGFSLRYAQRFGASAPALNSMGESCYEALTFLAHLAQRARSFELDRLNAAADTLAYEGPRGLVRMSGNHLLQDVYLARADGLEFDVLAQLTEPR
jgi:ABC-type branched-subunit amino acid transport system substrate-binding protein